MRRIECLTDAEMGQSILFSRQQHVTGPLTRWQGYVVHCVTGVQRMSCLTEATTSCSNCYSSGRCPDFQTSNLSRFIAGFILTYVSGDVIFLPRYPKIMTDEGIRVVRQWLGSTTPLEEGTVMFTLLFHCVGNLKVWLTSSTLELNLLY